MPWQSAHCEGLGRPLPGCRGRRCYEGPVCDPVSMCPDHDERDAEAAIDAAQQQLKAAAESTLDEHLRVIAQRRVEEELAALCASGAWEVDTSTSYEVLVRRKSL